MPERKTLNEDLFYNGSSANLPRLHTCENKIPFWDFSQLPSQYVGCDKVVQPNEVILLLDLIPVCGRTLSCTRRILSIVKLSLTEPRQISVYASEFIVSAGGARGVMVIVAGYGHGDTSSNPGPDWLHFT